MSWFNGERSVSEQMLGLGPALARAKDMTVIDMGCAEGHISARFLQAMAESVTAYDCNLQFIDEAKKLHRGIKFVLCDIEERAESGATDVHDIVLALAILHKMHDVEMVARYFATCATDLLVIRLPRNCVKGVIKSKHQPGAKCDLMELMPKCGMRHIADHAGPRGERVWYFERVR